MVRNKWIILAALFCARATVGVQYQAIASSASILRGELGLGLVGSSSVWVVGGGAEMALTDQLAVRGELQGLGGFGGGIGVAKATGGLIWHLN